MRRQGQRPGRRPRPLPLRSDGRKGLHWWLPTLRPARLCRAAVDLVSGWGCGARALAPFRGGFGWLLLCMGCCRLASVFVSALPVRSAAPDTGPDRQHLASPLVCTGMRLGWSSPLLVACAAAPRAHVSTLLCGRCRARTTPTRRSTQRAAATGERTLPCRQTTPGPQRPRQPGCSISTAALSRRTLGCGETLQAAG